MYSFDKFIKSQILSLKGNVDQGLETLIKEWIFQGFVLVHDFSFGANRIAIDTIAKINGFKITIFGQDKESHKFLKSDEFYDLTGINKSLRPENNNRLKYLAINQEESIDEVSNKLNGLLRMIDKGNKEYNIKAQEKHL